MEEMKDKAPNMSPVEPEEELELTHTDKLAGIFTEPIVMFNGTSKFPPKSSDWLIPLFIYLVVMIAGFIVQMNNATIKQDYKNKILQKVEQQIKKQIESGQIQEEKRESTIEMATNMAIISGYVFRPIGFLFFFFLFATIVFLVSKYALRGQGTYSAALVSLSLPFYISIISTIITIIISYVTSRFINSPNFTEIFNINSSSIIGKLLMLLDVFQFWYLIIMSIGLSKMFKSTSLKKYIITFVGLWIIIMIPIFLFLM